MDINDQEFVQLVKDVGLLPVLEKVKEGQATLTELLIELIVMQAKQLEVLNHSKVDVDNLW